MMPRGRWRWVLYALAIALACGLLIRAMMPTWITNYVNRGVDRMGNYHGRVASVDVHLWRGTYSINELWIEKQNGRVPVPLVHASRTDLTISWSAIMAGTAVAVIHIEQPEVNFVNGASSESTQYGEGVDWRAQIEALLPVRLGEIHVHDGRVHLRDFGSTPPIDLLATDVDVAVLHLTARPGPERAGSLTLAARMLGNAPVTARAHFDARDSLRDFSFITQGTGLHLRAASSILTAYAALDVESGTADFVMELDAKNGRLTGYAKPIFHDVKMLNWKEDIEEHHANPFRLVWEFIAGRTILKNHDEGPLATRVEINGAIGPTKTNQVEEIVDILRNAFAGPFKSRFGNLPDKLQDH